MKRYLLFLSSAILILCGSIIVAGAAEQPMTTSIVVKLVAGLTTEEQAAVIARNGGVETAAVQVLRLHTVSVPNESLQQALASYQSDPQVERIEQNKLRRAEAIPVDPSYSLQWALSKIGWEDAYGTATPTGMATVAILDTGVDATHPDLAGKILPGTSMLDGSNGLSDQAGHGTWLAGIVAAVTGNGEGVAGVAYDGVSILPVTVLNPTGEGKDSDIIQGIIWAADHGANVILMAFSNADFSQNLQDAIDYAWDKGTVLVAATGNSGVSTPTYPAGDRGVVGVSATDRSDALVFDSNYGQDTFLAAPGADIFTTSPGNTYTTITGTSASAAVVAGVAGFMKAVDPALANGVIVGRLARSADAIGAPGDPNNTLMFGNGRISLAKALADTGTDVVQPAGVPGGGGPYVGPYVAAALTAQGVTVGPQAGSLTSGTAGSVSYPVTIAVAGSGGTVQISSVSGLPTGATASPLATNTNCNGGCTLTLTITTTAATPAGISTFTVHVQGNQNGSSPVTNTGTLTIGASKTNPTLSLTNNPVTYNGLPQATDVSGSVPGVVSNVRYDGSNTVPTSAGTYAITADFTPADTTHYNSLTGAQAGNFVIGKAKVTATAGSYSGVFDGAAHDPSACAVSGTYKGALTCTNDPASVGPNVGAGTVAPVLVLNGETATNFTVTPENGSWSITPAPVAIKAGSYGGVFDGAAHDPSVCAVSGTYKGALTCTNDPASVGPNVGAGTVAPVLVLNGEAATNFTVTPENGSWSITPAPSTVTVTCPTNVTYNGSAQEVCTATVTGAGGLTQSLAVNYANNTNAGTATASASFAGDDNHYGSTGSKNFTIDKASATCSVTGYSVIFDNSPHTATGSCTGVKGENLTVLDLSGTSHTSVGPNVGAYTDTWTFTDVTGNYKNTSGTIINRIQAWKLTGFYSPVDMNNVTNLVKGGSTVPLKFEIFAGATELTSTSSVLSITAQVVSCGSLSALTDEVPPDALATGGTALRYDITAGQFIFNWKTTKSPTETCYVVTATSLDGSRISANFKLK